MRATPDLASWLVCWSILLSISTACSSQQEADPRRDTSAVEMPVTVETRDTIVFDRPPSPLRLPLPPGTLSAVDSTDLGLSAVPAERRPADSLLERSFTGTCRLNRATTSPGIEISMYIDRNPRDTFERNIRIIDDSDEHSYMVIEARILSYSVRGTQFSIQALVNGVFRARRGRSYQNDSARHDPGGRVSISLEGDICVRRETLTITLMGRMRFKGQTGMAEVYNQLPLTFAMHGWLYDPDQPQRYRPKKKP